MNPKLQIVISSKHHRDAPGSSHPLSFGQRFKVLMVGLAVAMGAAVALVLALIVGSLLAAVLWIVLVAAIVTVIVKGTLRRVSLSNSRRDG